MNITVFGIGYVGLVTAVCLAEKGHRVYCVDINEQKINMLKNNKLYIYEKDLEYIFKKNKQNLYFSLLDNFNFSHSNIFFICIGTPEDEDGSVNLSDIDNIIKNIGQNSKSNSIIVIKSTVPIGTNKKIENYLKKYETNNLKFSVVSNPEFLSQGSALNDMLNGSRIIIGCEDEVVKNIMLEIYKDFNSPKIVMSRESAEMVKYASNNYLALKISYINEIANLCDITGANIDEVTNAMGYDERIGKSFLNAGLGYGGSCLPKDTKALKYISLSYGYELKTINATILVNEYQRTLLYNKAKKLFTNFKNVKVAVLGLTFKPETDDIREAISSYNIELLLTDGAIIQAYDPKGIDNFSKKYPSNKYSIKYYTNIEDTLKNTDICFIFTEWNQIKNITPEIFIENMANVVIFDGRNCYDKKQMNKYDIKYYSVGR